MTLDRIDVLDSTVVRVHCQFVPIQLPEDLLHMLQKVFLTLVCVDDAIYKDTGGAGTMQNAVDELLKCLGTTP